VTRATAFRTLIAAAAVSGLAVHVHAQTVPSTAPVSAPPPSWRVAVSNTTRAEAWHFFTPPPTGGDPMYAFVANRLRINATRSWSRIELAAGMHYVQFGGLPRDAVGPGMLGTGALYFEHSGDTSSRGVSLRTLNLRARLPHGIVLQGGRFGYTSGAESPSGRPKVESVKRARLDSRLIGEFEWSLYQRSFDGIRGDIDRRRWHATAAWLRPTQGGFEEETGSSLREIDVETVTVTLRPGTVAPATDVAFFTQRYDDHRPVTARPDNSGRAAARADVGVTTIGAAAVGSAAVDSGEVDWLAWGAVQRGSWYELSHQAWSIVIEGGHQWRNGWRPWVRAGYLYASGDGNASDGRHGTFFPMLPTVRRYSFTTAYAPMNLTDGFAELIVRPTPRLSARADVRRLRLAHASDRWYAGSGATRRTGPYFGYAGRPSGGQSDLGIAVEGAADVALNPHWSINGFFGAVRGGRTVQTLFAGRWLRFAYVEQVLQF
jgi:hypothetical protein